ncbi:hypothetical protein TDB9533_03698 [Thalassocella blandensis]|nr:hypothetical protein TDB9533_03698 [Thalassocella blandensis]
MLATCNYKTESQQRVIQLLKDTDKVCYVVKSLFSAEQCKELKDRACNTGFVSAKDKYPASYRTNDRLQIDDDKLSSSIWEICKSFLPQKVNNGDLVGINSRLRFCKYSNLQSFSIHQDGVFYPDSECESVFTFLLYLNDAEEWEGGETSFYSDQYGARLLASYKPAAGDVAIFDHKLWHSGEKVLGGEKYILRSDVIYRRAEAQVNTHHDGYVWYLESLGGNQYISSSRDKSVKIWDSALDCLYTLKGHTNSVLQTVASSKGDVYAVSRDGYISVWNREDNYVLASRFESGHPTALCICLINDSSIVTGGSDGRLLVQEDVDGNFVELAGHSDWVWDCMAYKDWLVSCDSNGVINVYSTETYSLALSRKVTDSAIRCMTIDNDALWVGVEDGCVYKVSLKDLSVVRSISPHEGIVRDVLQLSNGNILSCGEDGKVVCYDPIRETVDTLVQYSSFASSMVNTDKGFILVGLYSGNIVKLDI